MVCDKLLMNGAYFSIPRSISSITKSPNPEKWTLALQNEINSLISQNVFDNTEVNISLVDKN